MLRICITLMRIRILLVTLMRIRTPDPACHFDADPNPDLTFHFDTDPDQIKALTSKKCSNTLVFNILWPDFLKLMRIRIRLNTLMRIRILPFNLMRIRIRNTDYNSWLQTVLRNPVPFWPLDPGSGMDKNKKIRIRIRDPWWTTRIIFPRA